MKKSHLAVLTAVTIWGASYSVTKLGLGEIEPITLAFFRFLITSIILLGITLVTKQTRKVASALKSDMGYFSILGLFGITFIFILENLALKFSITSEVALLVCGDPILIILLAHFFLKEKLNTRKLISIVLGIMGVMLIIFKQMDLSALIKTPSFLGNIFALTSSLAWATYTLMSKNLVAKYGPMVVLTIASIFGALFLFVSMLIFEGVPDFMNYSLKSWLIILFLATVVSTVAFYLWNYALKHLEASKAGMYMFLMPVIAVLVGISFLHERLTMQTTLGAVFILLGIYLAEKKRKKTT